MADKTDSFVFFKVRLDKPLHDWLKEQARQHDRSLTYLLNQAVKAYKQQREI